MSAEIRRLLRFVDADGRLRPGLLLDFDPAAEGPVDPSWRVQPCQGDLFGELRPVGPPVALGSLRLLSPVLPGKVVGIGSNYRDHAAEMGRALPTEPKLFLKPSTAVIGPGDAIPVPPGTERVDHEAELAVVIGRTAVRVREDEALDYVLGYSCLNDVTARDFQKKDGVFARAKGFDGFCPLGPWIVQGLDPRSLGVRCRVNGQLRQDGNSADLVFGVAQLVAFVSGVMTLQPGDVIATGTPMGVGPLVAGDRVEVWVEGIGCLANPVIDREDRQRG